jgi:hypothetical protein
VSIPKLARENASPPADNEFAASSFVLSLQNIFLLPQELVSFNFATDHVSSLLLLMIISM